MTVACSAIAAKETSSSEDCPCGKKRNGCGTIRIAGKLVRNSYAICEPEPGPMSRLNQPSRARRRQQPSCRLVVSSNGLLLVPSEDERQSDKPPTNIVPRTIANPQSSTSATATAGDEIVIDDRHLLDQRRVAKMLAATADAGTLRARKAKGPASTKIGRKVYYELNDLREWIDRRKNPVMSTVRCWPMTQSLALLGINAR